MKIIATNLAKRYNRDWIFKNFNYEFEGNQTYALTGLNGSGKSTLLQILSGQMLPTSGEIHYSHQSQAIEDSDFFQYLSFAAPYMDLIEEFTLQEMVSFHFQFKKVQESICISDITQKAGLSSSSNKLISNFSSGMKQRLKLALAFYTLADVIFLDEPTTNLDKKSIEWYLEHIQQIDGKKLILIASNNEMEYPTNTEKINILSYK